MVIDAARLETGAPASLTEASRLMTESLASPRVASGYGVPRFALKL
jgi:hypothetical protein